MYQLTAKDLIDLPCRCFRQLLAIAGIFLTIATAEAQTGSPLDALEAEKEEGVAKLENKVPDVVVESFEKKYPGSVANKWEIDSNGNWEAKFTEEDKDYRADFTKGGLWIETELSLDYDELPEALRKVITDNYPSEEINEIEFVDSAGKGEFFDVEFKRAGPNKDVEFRADGSEIDVIEDIMNELKQPISELSGPQVTIGEMGRLELLMEFGFNLLSIFIYAYLIYYLRHHDHKMLFLLLGFNLFLFPIFLLSSTLTAGFGFTIFALLALVRLRSDPFSKAEVSYLLGAVSLTFINAMMPARVELISTIIVLLTAWLGDHPSIWRSAYQTANIRYILKDTTKMLNQDYLRRKVAEDFQVEVNNIEIERVDKNIVRLIVMYRDLPEIRDARKRDGRRKKNWRRRLDNSDDREEQAI